MITRMRDAGMRMTLILWPSVRPNMYNRLETCLMPQTMRRRPPGQIDNSQKWVQKGSVRTAGLEPAQVALLRPERSALTARPNSRLLNGESGASLAHNRRIFPECGARLSPLHGPPGCS